MTHIVLASASPRRKELLGKIIADFSVCPCSLKEERPALPPKKYVVYLAKFKADNVYETLPDKSDSVVIGSDTIVVLDGRILSKPSDEKEAKEMLRALSGKTHSVLTGVCILSKERSKSFFVATRVRFFNLSDSRIDAYIATGSALDKAGAYGIQDSGFVKKIYGSYDNVMGLPTEKLTKEIKPFLVNKQELKR